MVEKQNAKSPFHIYGAEVRFGITFLLGLRSYADAVEVDHSPNLSIVVINQ